ncbi:MAG: hypothetical protein GX593_13890, partial [Actinomycetales bacterium]|nr:hypothetical protein [Actinomycetales bacterium]
AYEQCLTDEALDRETYPDVDWGCELNLVAPVLSDYLGEQTFVSTGLELIDGVTLGILLLVLFASVSFVAAEFSTGAIGTWLTFEPRRVRVYASKLGAAVLGASALGLVGYVITVTSVYLPFAVRGTTGEVTAQTWAGVAAGLGRFVIASALVATLSVALAFLLRHLAAAIGVAIGWLAFEQLAALAYPHAQRWVVMTNLSALREGGTSYYLDVCTFDEVLARRVCEWTEFPVSALQGGLVLGAIVSALTVVALLVFRRRDVT